MKFLIKIFLLPTILVINIVILFLHFILGIGTFLMNLISLFFIVGFIAAFIEGNISLGIQGIIFAYLFSPYGLPVIGYVIVGMLEGISNFLIEI